MGHRGGHSTTMSVAKVRKQASKSVLLHQFVKKIPSKVQVCYARKPTMRPSSEDQGLSEGAEGDLKQEMSSRTIPRGFVVGSTH